MSDTFSVSEKERFAMRLLADRESSGIVVRLFWDEAAAPGRDVMVKYRDRNEGVIYTLYPPRNRALDAFYHPNSYLECARESLLAWGQAAQLE
jgi:hypothetical protein